MVCKQRLFIDKLATFFQIPKMGDIQAWVSAYVDALDKFSDQVLQEAAKRLIEQRESRTFPLVAECLFVCRQVMAESSQSIGGEKRAQKDRMPEWTTERRNEADRLLSTYASRHRVLKEGWAWGLWDFCREQSRWPNAMEADKIRAKSASGNQQFRELVAAGIVPEVRILIEMRNTKLAKLAAIINRGVSAKEDV